MGTHHPRELRNVDLDWPEGGAGLFEQGLCLLRGIGVMDAEVEGAGAGGALLQECVEAFLGAPADADAPDQSHGAVAELNDGLDLEQG
jgi:hypothetical protein